MIMRLIVLLSTGTATISVPPLRWIVALHGEPPISTSQNASGNHKLTIERSEGNVALRIEVL